MTTVGQKERRTKEKYYLAWKECEPHGPSPVENLLDRALTQLCGKARFLELIHDFIVFDCELMETRQGEPRHFVAQK